MSWTNEVVLEFIELYRAEQHLWDNNHHLHRNLGEVSEAWNRIQNALSIDCTIDCLKKKKESLMTTFRLHYKRKKALPWYHTKWFAYKFMERFLSSKYECDSTNVVESECPSYDMLDREQDNKKDFVRNSSLIKSRPSQEDAENKYELNDPNSENCFPREQISEATTSLKRASTFTEKRDVDEYELYGQLLVKKLKKLDERQRYVVMHNIDSIIFRATMQSLQDNAHTASSHSNSPVSRNTHSPVFVSLDDQHNQPHYDPTTIHYEEHSYGIDSAMISK